MTTMASRIGGLLQIGQPADFFAAERSRQALQKLSLTGVFALSCLPFLSWRHLAPLTTWQQEFWAFLAGLLTLTVLLRSRAWTRPALSLGLLLPLSFAALTGVQWGAGLIASPSVPTLILLEMTWAAALMLAAGQMDRAALMRAMGWGLIAAGVIGGVLGLVQSARIPALAGRSMFYAQDGLAYGFLAQRNLFADVQFMALLALSFTWAQSAHPVWRAVRFAALSVIAASAAASGSNALLAQLAVALTLFWFWKHRDRAHSDRLWKDLLWAMAVMTVAYTVYTKTGRTPHLAGVSILRTLWMQALHTIAIHPLTGIGLGNTPSVFYAFAAGLPNTPMWHAFHAQGWSQVHNLVLQLWMEGGLAGLGIALGLYAALAWGWWRARSAETLFAAALLTVLLVHSLVEFPLWNLPFLGIAAICLAVLLPSFEFQMPRMAALVPVVVAGMVAVAFALALQMNARVGVLQGVAAITFNPQQIGTVASVARELEIARRWTGVTGTLLEPAAVYETATFSPQIVPAQERADYLAQLDRTMQLLPVGNIPYARADLLAHLCGAGEGVAAMREAAAAVPGPAAVWRQLLSAQADRGDAVSRRLLTALPDTADEQKVRP